MIQVSSTLEQYELAQSRRRFEPWPRTVTEPALTGQSPAAAAASPTQSNLNLKAGPGFRVVTPDSDSNNASAASVM